MSYKVGDVVTVVSMLGEVIGKLTKETKDSVELADPRLFVPGESGTGGFSRSARVLPFSLKVLLLLLRKIVM